MTTSDAPNAGGASLLVPSSHRNRWALPALILGGITIGGSPIFVRLSELGPIGTAFWRLALALYPLLWMHRRASSGNSLGRIPRQLSEHFFVASPGLVLAAELVSWHTSLQFTTVANSTLLANLAPIFVALFSWLFLKQKVSLTVLIGLIVSIAGVVVLQGARGPGGDLKGDVLALLSAVLYAGYIIILGRLRKTYVATTIMLWSTLSASVCTLVLAFLVDPIIFPKTLFGWAVVAGLAWISQAGGQTLIVYALAWLPPTFSSLTLLIQPVVAALLAWLLLGEHLTFLQAVGSVIVIFGVFLASRR
ncbi:DMT family transporter [Paraburkholderia aspalathi]|uniref:Threonine/homoserine efflux transporter RhtA n=1 Tax=Paraburkholderia aspalathi TaxID=1324617 RepID=A0A1I7BEA5_9BURK|nr:DMT family transporter [Paraburkholderia aspalathi]SFT85485.1 Threonine/homoserine efflux transporter RhtA [Paraburkholderia aspalathi]